MIIIMGQFSLNDLATTGRFIQDHSSKSVIFWPLQVDSNKDRLVSLDEFLVATKKKEFLEPDSWEVSMIFTPLLNITH